MSDIDIGIEMSLPVKNIIINVIAIVILNIVILNIINKSFACIIYDKFFHYYDTSFLLLNYTSQIRQ